MATSNPKLLLTKELQTKVEKALLAACATAEAKYGMKFELPEIRWDIKNTDGGRANYANWLVRLNLILCVENEEKFLATTVPHEMAHLINYRVNYATLLAAGKKLRPHGKEWKEVMAVLSVPAKTTHSYQCTSIQKPKRRKRGSKLRGAEADLLVHRLTVAAKRMPKRHLAQFIENLLAHQEELA
jgi:predicted SprT family Zn-dependent metalloprotease